MLGQRKSQNYPAKSLLSISGDSTVEKDELGTGVRENDIKSSKSAFSAN